MSLAIEMGEPETEPWPTQHYDHQGSAAHRLQVELMRLSVNDLDSRLGRTILEAKCFKIMHLCGQLEYDQSPVPPALNYCEDAIVRELSALASASHQTQAVAIIRDRASILEALLGRR